MIFKICYYIDYFYLAVAPIWGIVKRLGTVCGICVEVWSGGVCVSHGGEGEG